jgi:hypothetical protein
VSVEPELRTPDQWAKETDNVKMVRLCDEGAGLFPLYTWQHNSAVVVHGWREHAHHAGAPLLIERKDYEAALRSASTARLTDAGQPIDPKLPLYQPHEPALSPYKGISR